MMRPTERLSPEVKKMIELAVDEARHRNSLTVEVVDFVVAIRRIRGLRRALARKRPQSHA